MTKTLDNINAVAGVQATKDTKIFGNTDDWKLLGKASSESEGFMKSTKAMEIPEIGVVLQMTTQQRNPDGSYAVAETSVEVRGVKVEDTLDPDTGAVNGRRLVKI